MVDNKESFEDLVKIFSQGPVQNQYNALRALILKRKHHAALKETAFQDGLTHLYTVAADKNAQDTDRLLALATLGRVASTIKKLRKSIYTEIEKILTEPIPIPSLLTEPDDRSYIGFACETADSKWAISYCAQAVVMEEAGEQARVAFMKALVVLSGDLASAIAALIPFLQEYKPTTEDPGTSVTRRLRRIMASLREAIADTLVEPGEEPGKKLSEVIIAAYKNVPPSKIIEPLFDTADEAASVIHEMVRLRFSLATESLTYSALIKFKGLMSASDWEKCATESNAMERVGQDISEALLILARQGIADTTLTGELSVAAGSNRKGRQRMRKLAKQSGLSTEMQTWFISGNLQAETNIEDKGESQRLSEDSQLGDILVDALRFRTQENTGQQLLPELSILEPRIADEVTQMMRTGLSICDALEALGKKKGLRVRGNVGDEEDYAPLEHEVIGASVGSRRVRIIRPVVEQIREDGVTFVICKGLVEVIQ